MNAKNSTNRKFKRMFRNILTIFVILAMAFPATGSAYAEESIPFTGIDEFEGPLAEGWYWVNENPDKWAFNDGYLSILASPYGAGGENLLLRPVAPGNFMIKTHLHFEPDTNFQIAGLVIWQDEYNFLQFGHAFCDVEGPCVGNGLYFDQAEDGNPVGDNFGTSINDPSDVFLRLERRGDMVRAFYSADNGISWFEIGTHWIPSDFQVNGVGLTASQDISTPDWDIPANFDFFELTEGGGFLPEGFHDGGEGDVPSWACNANGWAADPDDREADVNIEVVVDDQTVANLVAGEFRQDLQDAGVCVDGNCSFSTSLWDLIASYEPHRVDVWAQDDTGEWVLLSNSAKTLTCRTYDIYTYDPATGTTKQITNLPDMHEFNPRWSPDAKKIVHDAWNVDWSAHGVYITDVKTGASIPLSGAEGGSYPTWSPSGKWIAFDRGADNDNRVFIVPPTGGTPRLVVEDAFMATWAPNGNRIAFHRPSDGGIWTTDLDGENQTKVAERGNGPAWSPDGEWIAFEVDGDVWKVQVNNGGNPRGEPIQLTNSPFWEGRPTWSFNSKTIAFHAGMGQDTDIWTIPAAGGEATWLTGAPNFGDYDANYSIKGQSTTISYSSFSPDGQAARQWVAAYTYDSPAGTFDEGTHPYHFDFEWSAPESGSWSGQGGEFDVSSGADSRGGFVLLRGPQELRGINTSGGLYCEEVAEINPGQPSRFLVGWLAENGEISYPEAQAHFDSITATVVWDDDSASLARHEIIPFRWDNWFDYVCTFTEAPPNPHFTVFPEWEWFDGYDWPDGAAVTITVEGEPECTTDAVSSENFFNGGFPEGCDLAVGDVVTFTDGETTRNHTIQNVAITEVDKESNTVSGTADAGALVYAWVHEYGYDMELLVEDGTWLADFGSAGLDLIENMGGRAEVRDEFGNGTAVDWWIPSPHFSVFPEWEYIEGWQWPDGALVTAEVDGKPECYAEEYSGHPDWDPNELFVPLWFPESCDVAVGDLVTVTDGVTPRTHTVQYLAVANVDEPADTISGTANPGAQVHVWAHGYDELLPTTDEDGVWFADFSSIGIDLVKGMGGRTEIRDEVGNATAVEWRIPDTRFTVWPEWNYLEGYEWPEGALVSISVVGKDICSIEAVSGFPEWDPSNTFFSVNFPEGCVIESRDLVTLSFESLSFTHQVQELAITDVNLDSDTVAGTAVFDPEQYILHTWIHGVDESYMQLSVEGGTWLADFGSQGFDLQPGMGGRVEMVDQASNATAVDWGIPNPRIVASITEDWFYLVDFAPDTTFGYSVYESDGGASIWEDTATTDGSGFVWVNADGQWDLEPGNYIVVSDGTSMKDLVIEGFTFEVFNAANGQLSGTAPEPYGRNVWVGIGFENDVWDMEVTTDGTGAWFADFGQPIPTDYWWVAAQIFDDDGDASELRPASQIIFLRPACGDTYTVQAGSLLELRYGSWVTIGEELAIQNAEHLTVELVLQGETVAGTQQPVVPRSEIPCGMPLDDAFGVYYVAQVGPLSQGTYVATVTWSFDIAVTDGYDADGDGVPEWYGPGEVFTREFTIIVP